MQYQVCDGGNANEFTLDTAPAIAAQAMVDDNCATNDHVGITGGRAVCVTGGSNPAAAAANLFCGDRLNVVGGASAVENIAVCGE